MKKLFAFILLSLIMCDSVHAAPIFINEKPGMLSTVGLTESQKAEALAIQNRIHAEKGRQFAEWEHLIKRLNELHTALVAAVNEKNYEKALEEAQALTALFQQVKDYATANQNYRSEETLYYFSLRALSSYGTFDALPKDIPFPDFLITALQSGDDRTITHSVSVFRNILLNTREAISNMVFFTVNESADKQYRDALFRLKNDGKSQEEVRLEHDIRTGKSGGYFSGLFARLKYALSGILSWIGFSALVGAFIFRKTNILSGVLRCVLASAICAPVYLFSVAILPFISGWFLFGAFIVGMVIVSHESFPLWKRFPLLYAILFPSVVLQDDIGEGLHGSAAWGGKADMLQKGHIAVESQNELAVGRIPLSGKIFRFMGHMLICAPTGSGKGIGSVIPNLLEYKGSCVVLDVKGENYAVTARQRANLGHIVHCIDPFSVTGSGGSINPLDRVDLSSPDCVGVSQEIAQSLVLKSKEGGDNVHFDEAAENLIQGLILFVKTLALERQTLGEVRRLVSLPLNFDGEADEDEDVTIDSPSLCFADVEILMKTTDAGFGIIQRAANSISGKPEKEKGSVLSTAQRHTAFLDDPRIAQTLGATDFNLYDIKQEKMSVFLVLPPAKLEQNARFVRLIVDYALAAVTSTQKMPEHRVAFFLDEFHMLGYMAQIEKGVALLRGFGAVFIIYLQDLSQLKAIYKKWQTFFANCCKVFYGTADYDTAKYVSDSLGKKTVEYETESESSSKGFSLKGIGNKSANKSQHFTGRSLLTPDEVMRMGPERPIVLISGERPYQLERLNYLRDSEYQGLYDPNPYHS